MGLEQHWEAHCNKCGNWDRLLPGAPKERALALGWARQHTQYGVRWFCPACVCKQLDHLVEQVEGEDHGIQR